MSYICNGSPRRSCSPPLNIIEIKRSTQNFYRWMENPRRINRITALPTLSINKFESTPSSRAIST